MGPMLAARFRDRDEEAGRHAARHRMMPAQQAPQALDAEVVEIDHRLVMDFHLAVAESLLEITLDLLVLEQAALHLRVEHADAVAPGGLRFIERHVSMAQRSTIGIAVLVRDRNADRARDIDLDARLDHHRLADRLDQFLCGRHRLRLVLHGQGHDEFVTAETRDAAAALVHDRETVRDGPQHRVAVAWPSVSLICLNRSRSSQRIEIGLVPSSSACRDWS